MIIVHWRLTKSQHCLWSAVSVVRLQESGSLRGRNPCRGALKHTYQHPPHPQGLYSYFPQSVFPYSSPIFHIPSSPAFLATLAGRPESVHCCHDYPPSHPLPHLFLLHDARIPFASHSPFDNPRTLSSPTWVLFVCLLHSKPLDFRVFFRPFLP
jgi:hypothetical protein